MPETGFCRNRIFRYKERIIDSILIQEIQVKENSYSGTFHTVVLIELFINYKKKLSNFELLLIIFAGVPNA